MCARSFVCVHVCVFFHCVTVIYADIVRGCVRETLDALATACTIKSHISILHKIHRIDCRRSQLKGFSEIIEMPQFYCPYRLFTHTIFISTQTYLAAHRFTHI